MADIIMSVTVYVVFRFHLQGDGTPEQQKKIAELLIISIFLFVMVTLGDKFL